LHVSGASSLFSIVLSLLAIFAWIETAAKTPEVAFVGADLGELSFLQALQDQSVHTIILTGDYRVGDELNQFSGAPLPITRWVGFIAVTCEMHI
jgi:hypothetical protein